MDWHTELERELIEDFGGTHTRSFGPDGDQILGDSWHSDRGYRHQFIPVEDAVSSDDGLL